MTTGDADTIDARPKRWSRSGAVVSDLIVIVLIIVAIVGAASGKLYLAVLCGLVLVLAFIARLWTKLALVDVDYGCFPESDRFMVGDAIDLTLAIENRKPLPLPWLSVEEAVPEGLQVEQESMSTVGQFAAMSIRESTSLGPYERVRIHKRLRARRRGVYGFGPTRVISGDIFGFYQARLDAPRRPAALVVYPRTVPLPQFELPPYRPMGDVQTNARLIDDPTRPAGLREYRVGDAARTIDWKATARREQVYVRTYDSSQTQRVMILLECDTSLQRWRIRADLLEAAVTGAASVAQRTVELGYAVGLVSNGNIVSDRAPPMVPAGAGPDQLTAIMTSLAGATAMTVGPLEVVIARYGAEAMPPGATIVYVAASFRTSTVDFIADLGRRGHRIVAMNIGNDALPEDPGFPIYDYRTVFELPELNDA